MAHPPRSPMDRGSRGQLVAVLLVVLLVAVAGVLVVVYPRQFGLPGLGVSTPAALEETPER